ncbi:MAG: hypothetical protein AAB354_12530, partial [candidate division KSB1 bacterium]
ICSGCDHVARPRPAHRKKIARTRGVSAISHSEIDQIKKGQVLACPFLFITDQPRLGRGLILSKPRCCFLQI